MRPRSNPLLPLLSQTPHHRLPRQPQPTHHQTRLSSTAPSLLRIRDIPAPHTGHIRLLTLNNPTRRNAISKQLLSELSTALYSIKNEVEGEEKGARAGGNDGVGVGRGTRVLIIGSEVDGVFCAGADLKERAGMGREETLNYLHTLRSTLSLLSRLPHTPTLTALSGPALGGGLELALASDMRILSPTASVGLPETKLGIIPGAGGMWRLGRLVGRGRAMEMVLSGRRVGGREAREMGIAEGLVGVDNVDDDGDGGELLMRRNRERVVEQAVRWAEEWCRGGPVAVRAAVGAVREGTEEAEGRAYEGVLDYGLGDRDEALRAFKERRGVRFRGL